jgi:hypothetical protein
MNGNRSLPVKGLSTLLTDGSKCSFLFHFLSDANVQSFLDLRNRYLAQKLHKIKLQNQEVILYIKLKKWGGGDCMHGLKTCRKV